MKALDLFCGAAGGWSLGLHRAGFQTVAACEIDPWRRAVFGHNNPRVRLYDDVKTLTASQLLHDLGFLPDIIVGSPPCQDASTANAKGKGVDGERTGLFFEAVRLVREVRPVWACFENVPGLRTRGYDRVHDALEQAGYAVWPLVVGAVHAGAPHLRKRVWIIAKPKEEQVGRAGFARQEAERVSADASRDGIRIEPGRSSGARWASEAVPAQHDPLALSMHGLALAGREPDGDRAGAAADPEEGAGRSRSDVALPQFETRDCGIASDAHHIGIEQWRAGPSQRGSGSPEAHGFNRLVEQWWGWNGGPPSFDGMDDGVSQALASRRGIGRACLAALGDAILPQISEAIGRTILSVSAAQLQEAA